MYFIVIAMNSELLSMYMIPCDEISESFGMQLCFGFTSKGLSQDSLYKYIPSIPYTNYIK